MLQQKVGFSQFLILTVWITNSTPIFEASNLRLKVRKTPDFLSKSGVFMVRENITDYFTLQLSFNGTEHTFSMAFYKVLRFLVIHHVILLRKNGCRYKIPLGWASISFP